MSRSIGALEFRSISKGIEVSNEVVKKASVEIIYFKTICPGKFLVIVTGDEGEVNEAIDYGVEIADGTLVDSFKVHAVSQAIVQAFKNKYDSRTVEGAIGIMETGKVCTGIKALDHALKSSDSKLIKMQLAFGIGGKLVYVITGTLSSIECGLREAKLALDQQERANISIIPSPSEEMTQFLI
ncbi:MAG: BMC domain-containing protein [Niameybacter sp.]|uniref:BMC domain-containing protein n=1 Tax=Niameybacter sp. TaxID=2033640 RepID=UPI002FCC7E2B